MQSATVSPGPSPSPSQIHVSLSSIPIPVPTATQILIKVSVSGSNPKDWKTLLYTPNILPHNTGDDIAGTVAAVGKDVTRWKVGDRVAALHELRAPFGSYAEYAVAWESTVFRVPAHVSFEEAATVPLAAMTAAMGLHAKLGLPSRGQTECARREEVRRGGVVVYGAAGAVGAFTIKWLVHANLHPIIAVAGRGIPFVEGLLDKSKGDGVVDYRDGDEAVVKGIAELVPQGGKLMYAFDVVSDHNSYVNICKVLDPHGHITLVLPGKKYDGIPATVHKSITLVGAVHGVPEDLWDFGAEYFRQIELGLKEGWLKGHPYEVVPGGLDGVQKGLENLRDGKNSAKKYVFRIGETESIKNASG
ncbi:NADPH2:quinone reductase [Pyrenochaeta sp. DS3sAY3a]|nr:NADPH2:quinone reductase [Pyrenochaeta sp. DS3sAY3a]